MMQKYLPLITFLILTVWNVSSAQNSLQPIVISPVIGDTLDKSERAYNKLFETISGFQSAVYFLSKDSTLYAKVFSRSNSKLDSEIVDCGQLRDYINRNFSSTRLARPPWSKSVFFAFGYGKPLETKLEAGINIGSYLALSLGRRYTAKWKGDFDDILYDFNVRIIGPFVKKRYALFLSAEISPNVGIMSESDSYEAVSLGAYITANRIILFRPEIGFAHTSDWHNDVYGNSKQTLKNQAYFNLGIEFDFKGLLK
jgi:hypothetical protein